MRTLLLVFSSFLTCAGVSGQGTPFRRMRCHSCTSVNASQIVGGAGVDPGVFLSTIRLSSVPVTVRCRDPFDRDTAIRAGATTPLCDDGLCVKINYTDIVTGTTDVLRACLPESQGVFKQTCASFSSSQAVGRWCVCGADYCNSGQSTSITAILLILLCSFLLFPSF